MSAQPIVNMSLPRIQLSQEILETIQQQEQC
nr:MAG TPA: hypothetical protein [Caudoviricetes sp.]